jgi:O-acetyl-ADP-ribose deacetylase (regulator of RNase III)
MTVRLTVRQGDITSFDGDAIVNAANNHLVLGAGVAGAIRVRGGPSVQEECDRHGPIGVGDAVLTGAGDLGVRWIIHAAAMGDEPVSERSVRDSTAAAVRIAVEQGMQRVAVPVLGSGIGGFDFEQAVIIMRDAIRSVEDTGSLEEIVFYGFLPAQASALERLVG